MTAEDYLAGQLILIDKPLGWTSFQVVNKLRWLIRKRYGLKKIKVGHAGTLDPLATGLLVICTGKFTKKIQSLQADDKVYTGTITLGATTPSYDLETEIDQRFALPDFSIEQLKAVAETFTGEIDQKPPIFSAIKKDGIRMYELARSGEQTEVESRKIRIDRFDLTRVALPELDFLVSCSKGTYIRSLANDFGRALKNGAHLSALRRTQSGDFKIEEAMSIEDFQKKLGDNSEA